MKREHRCPKCGHRVERDEKDNAEIHPPECGFCGIEMEWAPTGMNFSLKGKGWTPKGDR